MPERSHYHRYEGVTFWIGRDDDGDFFVSINTEDAEPGLNDDDGFPQIFVYLNDATINDPKEQAVVHVAHRKGGV